MKKLNRLLVILPVIGMMMLGTACQKPVDVEQEKDEKDSAMLVQTQVLKNTAIARMVSFSTNLEAEDQVYLVPTAPGKVDRILVDVGTQVRKGQLLVQMDQTTLLNSKTQLANLKTTYDRNKILLKSGSLSQQVFDEVETQYEVSLANVQNLEKNTNIKAPFSGVIFGKYIEEGEMYSGTPNPSTGKAAIVSLVKLDKLKAIVNVPESYYPKVKKGMIAEVKCDVFSEDEISGIVSKVYPTINAVTHSFQVEIAIDNPKEKYKPGMYCTINLNFGEVEAMVVPYQAVLKTQGSNERYVFVNDKGKAKKIIVGLGQRFDDKIELISKEIGIGTELVVVGQAKLKSGDLLNINK